MNSELSHALELTQRMVSAAKEEKWQQLFQISNLRQQNLESAFKHGINDEDEVGAVQLILKLDAEIKAQVQANKATLLGELRQTRHQIKANNLYHDIASQKE